VLDIRQGSEYQAGHLPHAAHIELGALTSRTGDVAPGPVTVMCGHGERALTAATLLQREGRRDIAILDGGPADWAAATGGSLALGA
jgi:hydroxyacylglutathione hydrolase